MNSPPHEDGEKLVRRFRARAKVLRSEDRSLSARERVSADVDAHLHDCAATFIETHLRSLPAEDGEIAKLADALDAYSERPEILVGIGWDMKQSAKTLRKLLSDRAALKCRIDELEALYADAEKWKAVWHDLAHKEKALTINLREQLKSQTTPTEKTEP